MKNQTHTKDCQDHGLNYCSCPSPLPWTYKDEHGFTGAIFDADGKMVFGGDPCEGRIEPDDENMKLTLRAVNSHEELLETVKGLLEYVGTGTFANEGDRQLRAEVMALVAKAEGRS